MMLRHVSRDLARRAPAWDKPSKIALGIAIILLVLLLALGFTGPAEFQLPARIGAFGLLVSLQLLFLWANRRDISPYHQAQQHFIAGEYQQARAILERIPASARVSVDALVLLGNTYRHLRHDDASQRALARALEHKPRHHLALFSMGKLRLVAGEYEIAQIFFARALEAGAPAAVQFELGQTWYLLGETEKAIGQLRGMRAYLHEEPARLMLAAYYLWRLGDGDLPARDQISVHIQFWRDEAERYHDTPYGAQLRVDVEWLSLHRKSAPAAVR